MCCANVKLMRMELSIIYISAMSRLISVRNFKTCIDHTMIISFCSKIFQVFPLIYCVMDLPLPCCGEFENSEVICPRCISLGAPCFDPMRFVV